MKANNNSPAIRFAGFVDPWERRKLGEHAVFRRGLTYSPSDISSSGIRVLRSSNIDKDIFVLAEDDVYVKETAVNIPLVAKGDILITAANGSSRLVGKHALIIDDKEKMVHGGFMLLAHPYGHSAFVNALMHAPWYSSFIRTYIAGGNGAIGNLNKTDLETQDVASAPEQEQDKIGSLFSALDRLITLHQRKYEKLVNLKKAMLDKMFPKNGELVPEVRFAGFSGNWERRKLGDMVQVRTGFPFNSRDFSSDGELLVITNGNIQDESDTVDISSGNRITVDNVKLRGEYELDEHDILVTMDGNVGRTAKVSHHNLILAQRVGRLTARNNREYVYQSLNTGRFTEEMTVMSHGGTIKHISLTEIGGYVLDVPRQTEEQERIGTFLLKLDHLIKLQGRRLEHFLIIKSAFLEKMFV